MELDDHPDFCLFGHGEQRLMRGREEGKQGVGKGFIYFGHGDDSLHDEKS